MNIFRKSKRRPISDVPAMPDSEQAWKILDLAVGWVKHAEAKSGLALTATGVGGGVLYNVFQNRSLNIFELAIALICGIFLLLSGVFSATSIWPRLRHSRSSASLIYFDHVAGTEGGKEAYLNSLSNLTKSEDSIVREVGGQIWEMSNVARRKFAWAGWAVVTLLLAYGSLAFLAIMIVLG